MLFLNGSTGNESTSLHSIIETQVQGCKNIFLSGNVGNGEKITCEMKVLFTIGYIQYTIVLHIYLLKRYIDKVTESGIRAIKVSGDVKK